MQCSSPVRLNTFGGNLADEALALYPTSEFCTQPKRCVEKTYMTMVSDLRASCPNNELAKQAAGTCIPSLWDFHYISAYKKGKKKKKSAQTCALPIYRKFFLNRLVLQRKNKGCVQPVTVRILSH